MENIQEAREWSITGTQISTIWRDIYPRIVALSWLSEEYRALFEREDDAGEGMNFRINEINRIAAILYGDSNTFAFPEGMGIRVRPDARRTNFFLVPSGLIMPWPERPTKMDEIIEAYALIGGPLPRTGVEWSEKEEELYEEITARSSGGWEDSKTKRWGVPPYRYKDSSLKVSVGALAYDTYFYGNHLLSLIRQVQQIVAWFWDNTLVHESAKMKQIRKMLYGSLGDIEESIAQGKSDLTRRQKRKIEELVALISDNGEGVYEEDENPVRIGYAKEYEQHPHHKLRDISLPSKMGFRDENPILPGFVPMVETKRELIPVEVKEGNELIIKVERDDEFNAGIRGRGSYPEKWKLILPFPRPPQDLDAIFKEMILGKAANPLYTKCPSMDCPD